ncbi:MAG: hypothetical protein G01um101448_540 [Parcubacteria group bacterium Gr01-1014_48]|nr:MAG: hypothetical protein Greene041614_640 [Parcubacteria group bacterium Greene0416_14]TSC73806.1 MAG: hypothetical protein G01um101448_540 [Parcubacteria group bacterium Gr01-1014_48]TSD01076.1 MAG: hypothetical protein Greene101415_479 [Parcubacteria group bacterium Greene1014_15]TSD08061.1 MAG: hypothetical protein Greene07144_454 [Parcubacteria group bacterium Greene0714_4]
MTERTLRQLVYVFATVCILIVLLGFIPSFTIGRGYLFGIYKTDMWDDILHITSALAAAGAAFYSTYAVLYFFKIIGTLYTLDAMFGFFFEHGFLDLSIFLHETVPFGFGMRLAANTPHFIMGLFALYVGFVLSKKIRTSPSEQPTSYDMG